MTILNKYIYYSYMQEEYKFFKLTHKERKNPIKYEVSNYGNIKINGIIIYPNTNIKGYICVAGEYLHRVVAELFIPNPENKPEIDHIDGNRFNNHYTNLQWVTHQENLNNPITKTRRNSSLTGKKRGPYSEQTKQNMRKPHLNYNPKNHNKANLGRIHVSKNGINKMIPKEKTEQYLNEGYVLGWIK